MSVGSHCRPALYTRRWGLRMTSSPFDWMMRYSLETLLLMFQTSFSTFFTEIVEDEGHAIINEKKRWVVDTTNDITSIHHFSIIGDLKEEQVKFRQVMLERFARTDEYIKKAQRVALICTREDSLEDLKLFLQRFSHIYKEQSFTLINIRNNPDALQCNKSMMKINNKLEIVEYEFSDKPLHEEESGNSKMWDEVMQEFRLRSGQPFVERLKSMRAGHIDVIVYGAGVYGSAAVRYLNLYGIRVEGVVVTEKRGNPDKIESTDVLGLSEAKSLLKDAIVIIAVTGRKNGQSIKESLKDSGAAQIIEYNDTPFYYGN